MIIPIVLIIITIEQAAIDIYLPSLPSMSQYFIVSSDSIQSSLSFYLLGFSISPLLFGPLSDRFGRRRIIIFGLSIYTVASAACACASSISLFLIMRFIKGIGSGALAVAVQAIIRDCFKGKRLAIVSSYTSITWSLVPIIAPAIGSYIQQYFGWQANFWLLTLYAGASLLAILKLLHETMDTPPHRIAFKTSIQ